MHDHHSDVPVSATMSSVITSLVVESIATTSPERKYARPESAVRRVHGDQRGKHPHDDPRERRHGRQFGEGQCRGGRPGDRGGQGRRRGDLRQRNASQDGIGERRRCHPAAQGWGIGSMRRGPRNDDPAPSQGYGIRLRCARRVRSAPRGDSESATSPFVPTVRRTTNSRGPASPLTGAIGLPMRLIP